MIESKERSAVPGALARALLVVVLTVFPAMAIPSTAPDTAQSMVLLALFLGGIVFAEYASTYPGLIEFRYAAPFNRTRFTLLALIAILVSLIFRQTEAPGVLGAIVSHAASLCGGLLDFAVSPVSLLLAALPGDTLTGHLVMVRDAAALAYVLGLTTILGFVAAVRLRAWPMGNAPFNVWMNLPTFDPTAGNDVVLRLQRHARINVALGVLLPFLLPAAVYASAVLIKPLTLTSPMGFVWGITLWAFVPTALVMRGVAMARVARLIRINRRRLADSDDGVMATA